MKPSPALRMDVDPSVSADRSIVLRYAPGIFSGHVARADLLAASRREGVRLVELEPYKSVRLWALDETTAMQTGTCKSLDGCVSTAICRGQGIPRIAFSSGANAGTALTDYAARTGLETFFFCPDSTLYKLDGALFDRPGAHLVAVGGSDRRVKEVARIFGEAAGVPLAPRLEWRTLSAACRGFFIAEQVLQAGVACDWFSQAVCAGYGPIGVYRALDGLARSGGIERRRIPKFLGIQQAGLCPVVRAWEEGKETLDGCADDAAAGWREEAIEPALYNVHPDQTYPMLHRVLKAFEGGMTALAQAEFERYAPPFVRRLEDSGIYLTKLSVSGSVRYLERAGILAGAGTMKAIEEGRIAGGQSVLCALTGGAGRAPRRAARPEFRIAAHETPGEAVPRCIEEVGAR